MSGKTSNKTGFLRNRFSLLCIALAAFLMPACQGDGHFTLLGYTTRPNYDESIRTVYVPIFENQTFRRGVEFDLTRAVIREINGKTPYRVVSCREAADTELFGTIIRMEKRLLNRNQLNEVREAETTLGVQIVWRDLRTGNVLSTRRPRPQGLPPGVLNTPQGLPVPVTPGSPPSSDELPSPTPVPDGQPLGVTPGEGPAGFVNPEDLPPGAVPLGAVPPGALPPPPPTLVNSIATFIPELGGSITTAEKQNVDRLATHIVSMMEEPW